MPCVVKMIKVAIGQDSHRFCDEQEAVGRELMLGGVMIPGESPLFGNSDADVILHALTNAISGITGVAILGTVADALCKAGHTDSAIYVSEAMLHLKGKILHVSFSVEGKRPKLLPHIPAMRAAVADLLQISVSQVMLTATTGEELTAFGRGEGMQALCVLTVDV